MSKLTATYSAAAPYIRQRAAYAAYGMHTAKTQRDRAEKRGQLYGLVNALDILLASPEGTDSPGGIADEESLPQGAVQWLRDFIGSNADRVLGTEP